MKAKRASGAARTGSHRDAEWLRKRKSAQGELHVPRSQGRGAAQPNGPADAPAADGSRRSDGARLSVDLQRLRIARISPRRSRRWLWRMLSRTKRKRPTAAEISS